MNRLRTAGKTDFVDKLVEIGAAADAAKMSELGRFVDGVIGDEIVPKPATGSRSLTKQTKAWLAAVTSFYDARTHDSLRQYANSSSATTWTRSMAQRSPGTWRIGCRR